MKYKLIAVDLDGTLLNDKKLICDYNMDRINKALNMGVKFVLCSGRLPSALRAYSEMTAKGQPVICSNGAILLDGDGGIIYKSCIDKNRVLEMIDIFREEKDDTYYHFYDENTIYTEQFTMSAKNLYEFSRKLDRKLRIEIRVMPDLKSIANEKDIDINKIVVIDEDLNYLSRLREKLKNVQDIEITSSEITNIEIMNKGVSKGSGVNLLARYYNIPIDECITIGNDENDISMIESEAFGVAVSNAKDPVKQCADYVTSKDNNEGAIGEVIDKFILN
ncbi:HAD family phosphatase [Clostridium sp. cel8]|uniref:Cof-type HAD-IIB family hydrolase n=1 Tax=Clostridium sp. cel8 TaxID=2663123 RepID=UPI0015F5FB9A|nr:HAD family phosphatase [Clostridium sp. cel8]